MSLGEASKSVSAEIRVQSSPSVPSDPDCSHETPQAEDP